MNSPPPDLLATRSRAQAMPRSRHAADVSSHLIEAVPPDGPAPLDWRAVFENDQPVELEIGSGKGLFLLNAAAANPGRNFLGVELSPKYATIAAGRLQRHACRNAKIMRADARLVMARLVPAGSVKAVHVYFPDPWWKKRHKKRRVMTDAFLADVKRCLEPDGELRVASDVEEYFSVIRALIAARPEFLEQEVLAPKRRNTTSTISPALSASTASRAGRSIARTTCSSCRPIRT